LLAPLQVPASLVQSDNETLAKLRKLVTRYNVIYPLQRDQKLRNPSYIPDTAIIDTLDAIATHAMIYLLHKPPGARKASGVVKWESCRDFLAEVFRHGQFFGIKFLLGDFHKDGANYWLERLDPETASREDFDRLLDWMKETAKKKFVGSGGPGRKEAVQLPQKGGYQVSDDGRDRRMLQYLTDAQRMDHQIIWSGGKLCLPSGDVFSTMDSARAPYSGFKNVYIYVCSAKTQKIYSMKGSEGEIHHSSFLQGEPVIAAGDWLVENGKVTYVNAASGHYRPGLENLRLFATIHSKCWHHKTLIQPEYMGSIYRMQEFLRDGGKAKPLGPDQLRACADTLGTSPEDMMRHA
jgi:hypothetical protein